MISFTYSIIIAIFFSGENYTKCVWPTWRRVYPCLIIDLANLPNHAQGDYLSPYNDLLSLHTLLL